MKLELLEKFRQIQMHSFLKNNVFSISFGTSLSKLAGCIRQIFIAAAFGVGVTYDAFNYAYIVPVKVANASNPA